MAPRSREVFIEGPQGPLQCAVDDPNDAPLQGVAVLCHPHPQFGGTMDNKVVQTLARAFVHLGWRAVRFNFRGVGRSAGHWGEGTGEREDGLAVMRAAVSPMAFARPGDGWTPERVAVGGFSFGAFVASHVALAVDAEGARARLAHTVLIGPAVVNFPMAPVSPGALIVHGEQDEVVPLEAVLDWARPAALPVTLIPGACHFFHGLLPVLKSLVVHHCRA